VSSTTTEDLRIYTYVNHVRIRSWNQPVLSKKCFVFKKP